MSVLLDRVADPASLREAWADVLAADREDGELGAGVRRILADEPGMLAGLSESLLDGSWRPGPLSEVLLPRENAAPRTLAIPPARDRIVERSLLDAVTPLVDPLLGPACFAYRPGLGVADAVQEVAQLRAEGLGWVAHTDVDDCFPTVQVGRVRRMLAAILDDGPVLSLVDLLLDRRVAGRRGLRPVRGVPQGAPLSPLLANLALVHLDERVLDAGFPMVRYADDFVVLAESRDEAVEALRVASAALEEVGMSLGPEKTEVMSFEEGFAFLGEDFGPRYPPVLAGHRAVDPVRRVVYVAMQGARTRVEQGRLLVESAADQEVLDVPTGAVERIVCFGSVGVSAGVRTWALGNGVDLVFLSRRGSYLGEARSAVADTRIFRLRRQLAAGADPAVRLVVGRAVVEAKVRKQAVLLRRFARRRNADAVSAAAADMTGLLAMLPDCRGTDEVMGVEGAAARSYFGALQALLPPELGFSGRTRLPPLDVVNSALSYLYAVLLSEAVSALASVGLDPAIGLLHADDDRRPSLALDLMEEFRPLVVDQVVVGAALRGHLQPGHGRREDGRPGVMLTRAGREIVVGAYETRMLQMTRGALPGFSGSLRRHLYRQAERLAAVIHDPALPWTGLSWR